MNEEKIERYAELKMDSLDRKLFKNKISSIKYEKQIKALNRLCKYLYHFAERI